MSPHHSLPITVKQTEIITLNDILGTYELGLVLIAGINDDTLSQAVQWVHGSDLANPAIFLTPRTVLLTTGTQFKYFKRSNEYREYVQSLLDVGVTALGFGVEIVHSKTPIELVDACEDLGLALFRVPYDTPFIQISQTAARLLAAKSYESDMWILESQRAISREAIRGRGLSATLDTLSQKIGRWVALTSSSGNITYVTPESARQSATVPWIRAAAKELAAKSGHANISRVHDGVRIHLQTIHGVHGHHGSLIIAGNEPLGHAERGIVEFASALTSIYLEQHRTLARAQAEVRDSIIRLHMQGATTTALQVARSLGLREISSTAKVCFFGPVKNIDATVFEQLLSITVASKGGVLGIFEGDAVMIAPLRSIAPISAFCEQENLHAGISKSINIGEIASALPQAQKAFAAAVTSKSSFAVTYSQAMSGSIFEMLRGNREAVNRARLLLAPLTDHDAKHADDLRETLEVWIHNHGQMSATAAALGLHRHTVSSRIKLIGDLLQRDLDDALVRAECLSALTLTSA